MTETSTINPQQREREVIAVLLKHGWEYLYQMLTLGQSAQHSAPMPDILCAILIDLGAVSVKFGQLLSTRPDLLSAPYRGVIRIRILLANSKSDQAGGQMITFGRRCQRVKVRMKVGCHSNNKSQILREYRSVKINSSD